MFRKALRQEQVDRVVSTGLAFDAAHNKAVRDGSEENVKASRRALAVYVRAQDNATTAEHIAASEVLGRSR